MIDFFSNDDLRSILEAVNNKQELGLNTLLNRHIAKDNAQQNETASAVEEPALLDDRSTAEKEEAEQDLYSVDNFTV